MDGANETVCEAGGKHDWKATGVLLDWRSSFQLGQADPCEERLVGRRKFYQWQKCPAAKETYIPVA